MIPWVIMSLSFFWAIGNITVDKTDFDKPDEIEIRAVLDKTYPPECSRIPKQIVPMISGKYCGEYADRAERAIREKNPSILACVDALKKYGGYGGTGDYGSYEYCQWRIDKRLD